MELDSTQQSNVSQENERKDDAFVKVDQNGVRRKLFQEDGTDSNETYQDFSTVSICDQSSRNWNREIKQEIKQGNKLLSKEKKRFQEVAILLISSCKNTYLTRLVEEQIKNLNTNPEINHCFPDMAYRIALMKTFNLIILDLNGDFSENLLKMSLAIRTSAFSNQVTPIVALKHEDTFKDDSWKKYGISEIIYGPLFQTTIEYIFERYLFQASKKEISVGERTQRNSTFAVSSKEDDLKIQGTKSMESNGKHSSWTSSRIGSPVPPCDSTEQITPYCETDDSNTTVQVHVEDASSFEGQKASSNPICSSSYIPAGQTSFASFSANCTVPTAGRLLSSDYANHDNGTVTQMDSSKNNSSGWNVIQQILDLHQNSHKEVEPKSKNVTQATDNGSISKTMASHTPMAAYPYGTQHASIVRSYPAHSIFTTPTLTQNTGYMINGTPGTSNMKLSLIPEEYAKHSNKERERRERIKDCCDELRKILPKQLLSGRRQDMATVLEMTVYYLKVVQDHIPTVIQQQLYQTFAMYSEGRARRKRKGSEVAPSMSCLIQNKYQRLSPLTTSTASNGCHNGNHSAPTYLTPVMQANGNQQSNIGYLSSMYHSFIANPYHATMAQPTATPTIYGSASLPPLDHVMHLRSQFYSDAVPPQNGVPCYLEVSSGSRDTASSSVPRIEAGKTQFLS